MKWNFSLRELIFATIAGGATVGMVTNNYWMEREVIHQRAKCEEYYTSERHKLIELSNRELKAAIAEFEPLVHRTNSGEPNHGLDSGLEYMPQDTYVKNHVLYGKKP